MEIKASSGLISIGSMPKRYFLHWKNTYVNGALTSVNNAISNIEEKTIENENRSNDNYLLIKSNNGHYINRIKKMEKKINDLEDKLKYTYVNLEITQQILMSSAIICFIRTVFF